MRGGISINLPADTSRHGEQTGVSSMVAVRFLDEHEREVASVVVPEVDEAVVAVLAPGSDNSSARTQAGEGRRVLVCDARSREAA